MFTTPKLYKTKSKSIIPVLLIVISVFSLTNCTSKKEIIMVTISKETIHSDFQAKPDKSINFRQVKKHYEQFPERWNLVFKFLVETDLRTIETGRIDLSEDVFAAVSEYETKKPKDALFESHKEYIDLQYVISGEELIGLTNDQSIKIATPYSYSNDITFYQFDGGKLLPASPENYFIFFPEDIHRPCIKTSKKSMVKKIVLKIKVGN